MLEVKIMLDAHFESRIISIANRNIPKIYVRSIIDSGRSRGLNISKAQAHSDETRGNINISTNASSKRAQRRT
jgi:hypothetical protein